MPAAAKEPNYTIYNHDWEPAMRLIGAIASPRIASQYRAVMQAMEEGWGILRPLALAAEPFHHTPKRPPEDVESVAWLAAVDVCDEFRGVVFECRDSIPTANGFRVLPKIGNAVDGCREIYMHLRVLRLASESPRFIPELRAVVCEVDEAFREWIERLRPVTKPIAVREERYLCDDGKPPRVRGA